MGGAGALWAAFCADRAGRRDGAAGGGGRGGWEMPNKLSVSEDNSARGACINPSEKTPSLSEGGCLLYEEVSSQSDDGRGPCGEVAERR